LSPGGIDTLVLAAALAAQVVVPAGLPVAPGADGAADSTARIVGAILEYSRWPEPRTAIRLCVDQKAQNAGRLDRIVLSGNRAVRMVPISTGSTGLATACDALYIAKSDLVTMRQQTAKVRGAAVVTITEADRECQSEAMFCLTQQAGQLSFRLNIDAVSRSRVRIDPRVLRLSSGR